MDINEILRQIRFGNLDNNQINSIIDAVKFRRSMLTEQKKHDLFPGLHVKFTSSRTGRVITGVVKKINRKFVLVDTGGQIWRVPANMLENAI